MCSRLQQVWVQLKHSSGEAEQVWSVFLCLSNILNLEFVWPWAILPEESVTLKRRLTRFIAEVGEKVLKAAFVFIYAHDFYFVSASELLMKVFTNVSVLNSWLEVFQVETP